MFAFGFSAEGLLKLPFFLKNISKSFLKTLDISPECLNIFNLLTGYPENKKAPDKSQGRIHRGTTLVTPKGTSLKAFNAGIRFDILLFPPKSCGSYPKRLLRQCAAGNLPPVISSLERPPLAYSFFSWLVSI